MLNQLNTKIMKKTMKGMLGVLLISMVMFSCKKEETPAPVANFSADVTEVFTGALVTFSDMSTNTPTTWAWEFGDAGTSTLQNPTHTYTEAGVYTVSLTVTNGGGTNTATKTDYITVTVEQTEAEKLVEYLEDPASPAGNYANVSMPAIRTADVVRGLQLTQKVYIMDIRAADDYNEAHIDGAVNVGQKDVLTHLDGVDLTPYDEVSVVCYSGQSAAWATSLLRLAGYDNVYSMKFGMSSWNATFSDPWNNNIGNSRAAQFTATPTAKGPEGDLPTLSTGEATGQEIAEDRINTILAEGFGEAAISSATVYGDLSSYYIVNYWPDADYTGMGHIEGAMQYTPKVDIHSDEALLTLPTDKTVVVYCYTGQTSANMAAYLRVIGYDAVSLTFGANGMIYDNMTKGKWNGALAPDGAVFEYPTVPTTK